MTPVRAVVPAASTATAPAVTVMVSFIAAVAGELVTVTAQAAAAATATTVIPVVAGPATRAGSAATVGAWFLRWNWGREWPYRRSDRVDEDDAKEDRRRAAAAAIVALSQVTPAGSPGRERNQQGCGGDVRAVYG